MPDIGENRQSENVVQKNVMLKMENVRKHFGATLALDGVSLSVCTGEVLAIVGENGAGKSTLMKVVSGAHLPDEGSMQLGGYPFHPRNPLEARRAGVAMIYQELSLAPHLTVAENIMLGMEPAKGPLLDIKSIRRRALDALRQVGRPDIPLDYPTGRLSVAEQQLVEVARSVAIGCRVLVLDEPTSSLSSQDIASLFDLIRRLRAAGHAVIYISHFLEEVKEISDRFVVLRDGRSVGEGITSQVEIPEIIALMVGRNVEELYPRTNRIPGNVALEVEGIAGRKTPSFASLQLRNGEVLGIAGLVGAGRTQLLRAIFGLDPVVKGKVKVAAWSSLTGKCTPADRWRQGVGMVCEDRKTEGLALNLSITDNLTLSKLPFFLHPRKLDLQAKEWANALSLRYRTVNQKVGDLSGGNQQKVAMARLMYHDVDVLLLDEPTRGIDVGSKAQIYQVIDKMAAQGKAVLIVSSYLPELLGICDRIAVMCRGKLGTAHPVNEVNERQIMLEATGAEVSNRGGGDEREA
jgi:ribose transport system ATP-binding protein